MKIQNIVHTDDYMHFITIDGGANIGAESRKHGVPLTGDGRRVAISNLLRKGSHNILTEILGNVKECVAQMLSN